MQKDVLCLTYYIVYMFLYNVKLFFYIREINPLYSSTGNEIFKFSLVECLSLKVFHLSTLVPQIAKSSNKQQS